MLKEERQRKILDLVNENRIMKVTEIKDLLQVTEVTIRRDLKELEDQGLLQRVHGGANSNQFKKTTRAEKSHIEKKQINLREKKQIAQKIADQIQEGETVFLGSGSTIELSCDLIDVSNVRIITNSIHIFQHFKNRAEIELILIGGSYRDITGAFVGTIANDTILNMNVDRSFVGVNGIKDGDAYTDNEVEGITEKYILNAAEIKYIVSDHSKFDCTAFYKFYHLGDADILITDDSASQEMLDDLSDYIKVI